MLDFLKNLCYIVDEQGSSNPYAIAVVASERSPQHPSVSFIIMLGFSDLLK